MYRKRQTTWAQSEGPHVVRHPGEPEQTIKDTRDWLRSVKLNDFDTTAITTYPGTPYFDEAEETSPGIWTYTYHKTGDCLRSV